MHVLAILNYNGVLELAHAYCPAICWCHHSTMSYTGFIIDFVAVVGQGLEVEHILVNIHAFGSFVILEEFLCMTANLGARPGLDMPFNFFPVFAVKSECYIKDTKVINIFTFNKILNQMECGSKFENLPSMNNCFSYCVHLPYFLWAADFSALTGDEFSSVSTPKGLGDALSRPGTCLADALLYGSDTRAV